MYCHAKSKRGTRCHNLVVSGSDYCYVHASLPGRTEERPEKPAKPLPVKSGVPVNSGEIPQTRKRTRVRQPETNPLLQTLFKLLNDSPSTSARRGTTTKTSKGADAFTVREKSNGNNPHPADNPFEALAAAVSAAAAAAEEAPPKGASQSSGRKSLADDVLGNAIYGAAYGIGYGVALPTLLLFAMLPDDALSRGLIDGAKAAQETVKRRRKR